MYERFLFFFFYYSLGFGDRRVEGGYGGFLLLSLVNEDIVLYMEVVNVIVDKKIIFRMIFFDINLYFFDLMT